MPSIPISCKTAAFNEDVGNADYFRFVVVVSVVFVFIVSTVFHVIAIVFAIIAIVVLCCLQDWPLEVFKVALKAEIGLQMRPGLARYLLYTVR